MQQGGTRLFELKPAEGASEWTRFLARKLKAETETGPYHVPNYRAFMDHPNILKDNKKFLTACRYTADQLQERWDRVGAIFSFLSSSRYMSSLVRRIIVRAPAGAAGAGSSSSSSSSSAASAASSLLPSSPSSAAVPASVFPVAIFFAPTPIVPTPTPSSASSSSSSSSSSSGSAISSSSPASTSSSTLTASSSPGLALRKAAAKGSSSNLLAQSTTAMLTERLMNNADVSTEEWKRKLGVDYLTAKQAKKLFSGGMRPIGEGGFSRVYLTKSNTLKKRVAVKKIRGDLRTERKILAEIACYQTLSHPNIVHVYHAKQVEVDFWIVMECLEGGNLAVARRLYKFQEPQIGFFAREILKGLSYLHENRYVHRDITTNNIMLSSTDGCIRIIDFGLSVWIPAPPSSQPPASPRSRGLGETVPYKMSGTPIAIPPEAIRLSRLGFCSDIWGLGMLVLELTMGKTSLPDSYNCLLDALFDNPPIPIPAKDPAWSPQFISFLQLCLTPDVSRRPSATALLQHPWITSPDIPNEMRSVFMQIFVQNALVTYGF